LINIFIYTSHGKFLYGFCRPYPCNGEWFHFVQNTDPLQRKGNKKLKTFCTLFGLSLLTIAQKADAFNFSIFAVNRLPISEDVIILLLGAGIVGFIALGRRKVKK
jgi:hypothetical protein